MTLIQQDRLGYTLRFQFRVSVSSYRRMAAHAVLTALESLRFSGRCEYYEAMKRGDWLVSTVLTPDDGREGLEPGWWCAYRDAAGEACPPSLTVNTSLSEMSSLRSIRYQLGGVATFRVGVPVALTTAADSWFSRFVDQRLATRPEGPPAS